MENFRNEHPGALFSVSFQVVQVLTTVASSRLSVSRTYFIMPMKVRIPTVLKNYVILELIVI